MQQSSSTWEETELNQILIQMVRDKLGFKAPMPVQKVTIPLFIKNYDVAVESSTGSGKTLAFLLPIFQRLLDLTKSPNRIEALVLAPTRELA